MTRFTTIERLPGPPPLPLVGNLWQLKLARLHLQLEDWARRYGPRFRFSIARNPIVAVGEHEGVLGILKDRPEGFRRLGAIERVNRELGVGGVFSAEGDAWRRQRALVMRGFDRTHLHAFMPVLARMTDRLIGQWRAAADAGRGINARQDFMRFTVDVTTNFVFGCDLNTLELGGGVLQGHIEKILPMINRRVNSPIPYWRYWKLPADRDLEAALVAVRAACADFIADARARLAADPERAGRAENLLEGLLSTQAESGGTQLSEAEIFGNTVTMLLAGEDTTAHTLAWLALYLAGFPEVQRRLQAEADTLPECPAAEDLERLGYLDAVIQETMRLKPVVPLLFLEAQRDSAVGGLELPKGTGVMLLMRWNSLDNRYFSSAAEFLPERWLTPIDAGRFPAHQRQVLMPFGAGPRFCPGRQLAMLEMKMAVVSICRTFSVLPDPLAGPADERFGFTMSPSHAKVRLARRG